MHAPSPVHTHDMLARTHPRASTHIHPLPPPPTSQIREENPRLARDSKVLRVTMDNVYEVSGVGGVGGGRVYEVSGGHVRG